MANDFMTAENRPDLYSMTERRQARFAKAIWPGFMQWCSDPANVEWARERARQRREAEARE